MSTETTSDPVVDLESSTPEDGQQQLRAEDRSWGYWLGAGLRRRLLPLSIGFGLLALIAVFTNSPGRYIPDTHLDLVWSPGRLLAEQAFLWNGSHGLGRPDEQSWLVVTVFFTIVRGLGASPEVAERLFHAALLTAAGTGMAALLRAFRPRIGVEHVFAGLFYMFNPFTVNWLLPSVLFLAYALAPWFCTVFMRGVRDTRPWRWAAVFALLLFVDGTINIPGLVYSLVPVVLLAVYLVHVERSVTWLRVLGWVARVAVLAVPVFAAAIVKYVAGRPYAAQNIATTETPDVTNAASSWTESWRGLGYWLPYARGLLRPGVGPYFSSPAIILATFIAPIVAVVVLWRSRWRPRLFFAATALVSLTLMVGVYPPNDPSGYGRLLRFGYDNSLLLQGWRNTYKAGPGWAIGVAALFGIALAAWWRRAERPWARDLVILAGVVTVAIGSFPYWSNRLYATADRVVSDRPGYWNQANAWLDANATDGRVLLLPGVETPRYQWGTIGDAALDTRRPFLNPLAFAHDTFQTSNLLRSIDTAIRAGTVDDSVAPIARRLGVRYIVIQNDLDRRILDAPAPAALDAIRRDRDLQRVATFGAPGQYVVDTRDTEAEARYQATLPPVEVYRVRRAPQGHARTGTPVLVSGDGDAWPSMARDGRLDGPGPVVYTAASDTAELKAALGTGAGVVISDTNRRRLTVATSDSIFHLLTVRYIPGYTLGPGQDLDRPANPLFTDTGTQSVAVFRDASQVSASSYGSVLAGPQPWVRPANAFDGDPRTAWQVGALGRGAGEWLQVDFGRAQRLSRVNVVGTPAPGTGLSVAKATLLFSDGSSVPVDLRRGEADVRFAARSTRWLRIRIDELAGTGQGTVGFADITIPGLALVEAVRLPEDLFAEASDDRQLGRLLADAPIVYQLDRARSIGGTDEELVLRRELRTAGERGYQVAGTLRMSPDTPDAAFARLTGETTVGSSLVGGFASRGATAADGDLATAWGGLARTGETVTTRFEPRPVTNVAVSVVQDIFHSRVTELKVTAGDEAITVPVSPIECPGVGPCVATVSAAFAGAPTDEVQVEATGVEAGSGPTGPLPIGIAEIAVDGTHPPLVDLTRRFEGCSTGLLDVDGRDVPLRLSGTLARLGGPDPIEFAACAPVELDAGRHRVDGSPDVLVDRVRLSAGRFDTATRTRPSVDVEEASLTRIRLRTDAEAGQAVLTGQAYDAGWRATADGRDLGPPQAMDTQSGWVLPRAAKAVEMSYAPEQNYRRALTVSLLAIAFCGWLAVRRVRR